MRKKAFAVSLALITLLFLSACAKSTNAPPKTAGGAFEPTENPGDAALPSEAEPSPSVTKPTGTESPPETEAPSETEALPETTQAPEAEPPETAAPETEPPPETTEDPKLAVYESALALYGSGAYLEAAEGFSALEEYEDSADYAKASYLAAAGYVGDPASCTMTRQQASLFISLLRSLPGSVAKAALFDGGDGIPMIWVAYGSEELSSPEPNQFYLGGSTNDAIYCLTGGTTQECIWVTAVLSVGKGGTVVQVNQNDTNFKFYHLNGGQIDAQPYATAVWNHSGDSTFNNAYFGNGTALTIWDFYLHADPNASRPLQAGSDADKHLHLQGSWLDSSDMIYLLEQYAALAG